MASATGQTSGGAVDLTGLPDFSALSHYASMGSP